MASGLVPASGQDGGPQEGREQGGGGAAVLAVARVDEVAGSGAQVGGGSVFGAGLGALGAGEHLCSGS